MARLRGEDWPWVGGLPSERVLSLPVFVRELDYVPSSVFYPLLFKGARAFP